MAIDNRLWGSARIRGELLKLGIGVNKRSVQKYLRQVRGPQRLDRVAKTSGITVYLVVACAEGKPAAIRAFEASYFDEIDALLHRGMDEA